MDPVRSCSLAPVSARLNITAKGGVRLTLNVRAEVTKLVVLCGLNQSYNGKIALVTGVDAESQRYQVQVDKKDLLVGAENLVQYTPEKHLQKQLSSPPVSRQALSQFYLDNLKAFIQKNISDGPFYVVSGNDDSLPDEIIQNATFVTADRSAVKKTGEYPFSVQNLAQAICRGALDERSIIMWNILTAIRSKDLPDFFQALMTTVGLHDIYVLQDSNPNVDFLFENLQEHNANNPRNQLFLFPMLVKEEGEFKRAFCYVQKKMLEDKSQLLANKFQGKSFLACYLNEPTLVRFSQFFTEYFFDEHFLNKFTKFINKYFGPTIKTIHSEHQELIASFFVKNGFLVESKRLEFEQAGIVYYSLALSRHCQKPDIE